MLEVILDKIGKDYMDSFFGDYKQRLMKAIWKHMKPPPYRHAPAIIRVLGKMAGRNRNYFISPPDMVCSMMALIGIANITFVTSFTVRKSTRR